MKQKSLLELNNGSVVDEKVMQENKKNIETEWITLWILDFIMKLILCHVHGIDIYLNLKIYQVHSNFPFKSLFFEKEFE